MMVLGSAEGRRERRGQGKDRLTVEEAQVEGVIAMNPQTMRPSPVRASLSDVKVMARVVRLEDPPEPIVIWDLARFSGRSWKWITNPLIRSHGRARTRSFHPLRHNFISSDGRRQNSEVCWLVERSSVILWSMEGFHNC